MSVNRYDLVGDMDGNCNLNEARMEHSEDGDYVSYEDYAALEAKCAALAAENEKRNTHSEALAVDNAALREVVERMVNQFAMSGISPEEKSINPAKSLMFDAKSALFMPATDAYLAEMRAQGVDAAIEELNQLAERSEKEAPIAAEHHRSAALYMKLFAAQVRKGVQS